VTSARPIWFGDDKRPAFGWFHSPASGVVRGGAVICPPLGLNYLQSHYALRLLAEHLAERGFCALRFDYDGTGDSAGSDDDPDRAEAWARTAGHAVNLVRRAGAADVSIIGMRLGAALAALVAEADRDIDQVVMWDPYASGRSFLRDQRAVSTITLGVTAAPADGSVEIPGTRYDAATASDIERISLANCSGPLARRVLVLTRAGRRVDSALLRASLAREDFSHQDTAGQAELMERYPPFQQLPHVAIGRIVDWLGRGARIEPVATRAPEVAGPRPVGPGASGSRVVEAPVSVPPAGLFGILTYREDLPASPGKPTVIFLNVATQHHVGPSRLWVELSRGWALDGTRSLRLDLSGLGDSPNRGHEHDPWECYKPVAFDDVVDAARWASPDDPSNVVLVGLCSGAYQALESALAIRARGVVAINPLICFVPPERSAGLALDSRRRIALAQDADGETAGGGEVGGREFGALIAGAPGRPDAAGWQAKIVAQSGQRSAKWLGDLVRHGTDTLLVCGDVELGPVREGVSTARLRELQATGRLRIEHLAGLQHDLLIADQRRVVTELVTEHVLERYSGA